ncbi:DDE-type integrase/transposase/recombinase [Burkholderia pseudomallei]|uniref:DDE-type integrase/transposase/recombinase n=1 Tax=Burkholderia pseudomallei TaxID=28450 RepID=UPI000F0665DE|nr:DDE-type integrase/transposase/recombinase [Burkholderia pseudomallei]VBD88504.1 integrase catalytic subunit [Burkholderia pseudomallei]VCH42607.1 integrase catalytic subunit [Burkholderia pseudomallei]
MTIELPVKLPPLSTWQRTEAHWLESRPGGLAKPFSDEELLAVMDEWGTPEEGRKYIIRARRESPSRRVGGRARNVVTRYTSRKLHNRIATESKNVEFPAVFRYDLDGTTREHYCQPPQVGIPTKIRRTSRRGKVTEYTHTVPYTPDILRLTPYGPFVEEWKNEEKLVALAKKYPFRFFKSEDDATWHCPEREEYFKALGITFCLRSSAEHNQRFIDNLSHLRAYLDNEMSTLTEDAWSAIDRIVSKRGAMSMAALFALAFTDRTPWNEPLVLPTPPGRFRVDDVLQAIADKRLFADLDYDDLSDPSSVVICSSLEQLDAMKWRRPPPHTVSNYFVMTVDVGTEFMFRGKPDVYTVAAMPAGKVLYRDSESRVFEELSDMRFQQLLQEDIQLLSTPQSTEELLAQCEYITDEQIQTARRRFQLVKQLEHADIPHPYSVRTIQRWQQKIRKAGESRPLQMLALIPGRPGGRGPQILDEVLALIREVALGANNPTNPSGSRSYDTFVRLCRERGVKPCSSNTFYLRSAIFRDVRSREGDRWAYNKEPAVWYLHRGDKIHGGRPFHRVHIDHTKLDIIIKVRGHGGRTYRLRPWLTIVIDAETRAVLAFYLSAHPPSTVSCMMAMRAMVALHKRVPDFLVCDNGKEFHSNAFDNFCDLNDITLEFRPAHESRFGSVIERLFGVTNQLLIHDLVGTTKAMQHVRTLTRSVDPMRADHLTFVELHGLLDYFFFVEYNRERRHPAHDHTPAEYMNNRFMVTGRRLARLRPYDERFMLQTLIPVSRGGVREIDNQMGIKVGRIWYWANEFAGRRNKKKKVEVRVDMWNVCVAYACIDGRWVKCVSRLLMQYRQLTQIELRYAVYEVRLRLRAAPESSFESVLRGVLAEHNAPATADVTGATRLIYGKPHLTEIESAEEVAEVSGTAHVDASTENSASTPHDEERVDEALVTNYRRRANDTPRPNPPRTFGRFKIDYSHLPVRNPI